jgi:putative protease
MSNAFNGEYGPYSMNITNNASIDSLENYRILTLSPELRKEDYENIIEHSRNPDKIEMLVQGSVELMKTRYPILYGNETKKDCRNYLIDNKNNRYSIHKSISGEELTIFDGSELSLIDKIDHLKEIGFRNFSIDGRFKDDDYYNIINVYDKALNGCINKKELEKYSPKNTNANF